MRTLTREAIHYYFDPDIPPLLTLEPGEMCRVETEDAIAGQLNPENVDEVTHRELRRRIPCSNPVTGPIAVRGARPGDRLAVTIHRIEVAAEPGYAWTIFDGTAGLLTNPLTLNEPLAEVKRILPVAEGRLEFRFAQRTVRVPLRPALGTIGVAPVGERRYSYLNGNDFLGNVDIPMLGTGATVVLPVHVAGGLVSLGDVHAISGHGEISSGAADCRAVVDMSVAVRPSGEGYFELPQLDTPETIGSIAAAGSLDAAVQLAYQDLIARMSADCGFETVEAYQLLSSVGEVQIGQLIPPGFHTAVAFVRREYLG